MPHATATQADLTPDHVPALDGLRGVALLLVMAYHGNLLGAGWLGVQLFFVLSGFLITRVLLREPDAPAGAQLRGFWLRRVLRIAPAYLVFLAVLAGIAPFAERPPAAREWAMALSLTYNIGQAGGWIPGSHWLGHVWSLCVEEHIYLVWPLLIIGLKGPRLGAALVALFLLGLVTRILMASNGGAAFSSPHALALLTTSHLDAFAAGGLGAWWLSARPGAYPPGWCVAVAGLLLASAGGLVPDNPVWAPAQQFGAWATLGWPNTLPNGQQFLWGYSLFNITATLLLVWLTGRAPQWPPLVHPALRRVGRVSYAGYLWHFPLAHALSPLVFTLHHWTGAGFYACLLMWFPLFAFSTYAAAELSYRLVEQPFLRRKHRWRPSH